MAQEGVRVIPIPFPVKVQRSICRADYILQKSPYLMLLMLVTTITAQHHDRTAAISFVAPSVILSLVPAQPVSLDLETG